jgi:DNA-binding GntR family transcriptional regulator
MAGKATQNERQSERIRNWLLAILRFAVTRDNTDRMCVLEVARQLDRQDPDGNPAFSFFARTSTEICSAIVADDDAARAAALARHFNAIGDRRLKNALKAATGYQPARPAASKPAGRAREYLWKGLPSK